VRRKQDPMQLGRGNVPGALSKAPPCYHSFLDSLRHDHECRIAISASPPGVYPAVEFQDGDLRTKRSMVT
jgi:hypothetical protein